VFDKIVAELKLENIFTHDDRIAPAIDTVPEPAAAVTDDLSTWDGIPRADYSNITQMSFFDFDNHADYEDEDEEDYEI
jgi:hypothetical protein